MKPLIVGHRGAPRLAPENTLASFRRAIELGVDAVEFDVRATMDKEIVVIHDAAVDRTTTGRGAVASYFLAELQRLDAGEGERISTLDEVLDEIAGKTDLQIEVKEEGFEVELLRNLQARNLQSSVVLSSFLYPVLEKIGRLAPAFRRKYLFPKVPDDLDALLSAHDLFALGPRYTIVAQDLVDAIHAAGMEVYVWTVDDPAEMRRIIELGVDSMSSNVPDVLLAVRKELRG